MTNAQLSAFRNIAALMQDGDNFSCPYGCDEFHDQGSKCLGCLAAEGDDGQLEPGELAVFEDYKGRQIGCRIEKVAEGMAWVRVCGLSDQPPYRIGDRLVIDLPKVKRAV